jgi:hypothetical protein
VMTEPGARRVVPRARQENEGATYRCFGEGIHDWTDQGEREGAMHCDVFLPSLPGPSLLSSALG